MLVDTLLALPRWVYVGLAAGAVASVAVAAAFLLAPRAVPDDRAERGTVRSSETRRRREIARYLDAIGEAYETDAEVAARTVAFLLPARDVAVTFDARTYYALEGTPTHPVLVEHEMPGVALGHRLPFETPAPSDGSADGSADVGAGPGGRDPVDAGGSSGTVGHAEAAYAVLGLPNGAGEDDVRRAYRTRVKEVHPDHGGDEAEFHRVREAYRTAREDAA